MKENVAKRLPKNDQPLLSRHHKIQMIGTSHTKHQFTTSTLILQMTEVGMECTLLKTLAFLIFQEVNMNKDAKPFRLFSCALTTDNHLSLTERNARKFALRAGLRPSQAMTPFQIHTEHLHLNMICDVDSCSLFQAHTIHSQVILSTATYLPSTPYLVK